MLTDSRGAGRFLAALIAATVWVGWLSSPVRATSLPGGWIEMRSEHFILVTDARPRKAKKVLGHLEQFRGLMSDALPVFADISAPPLRVFAARNLASFRVLAPNYGRTAGNVRVAGFFASEPGSEVIVLNELSGAADYGTIYHEYFHFLSSYANLELPPWLEEGLADYWGAGTELTSREAKVGKPLGMRLGFLDDGRKLLPLDAFFMADRTSPFYQAEKQAGLFYAQSWAMVHMMLLGDETGAMREQLGRYMVLTMRGVESLEAARATFGDLDVLQRKLRSYSRQPTFRYAKMPLPPETDPKSFKFRELSRGEAAALIAGHLMAVRPTKDAAALVEIALEEAPDLPMTSYALGLVERDRRR
ncbi:MAG: hypothetical protein AAFY88_28170, partial [Acidobacteriota bacterium]